MLVFKPFGLTEADMWRSKASQRTQSFWQGHHCPSKQQNASTTKYSWIIEWNVYLWYWSDYFVHFISSLSTKHVLKLYRLWSCCTCICGNVWNELATSVFVSHCCLSTCSTFVLCTKTFFRSVFWIPFGYFPPVSNKKQAKFCWFCLHRANFIPEMLLNAAPEINRSRAAAQRWEREAENVETLQEKTNCVNNQLIIPKW